MVWSPASDISHRQFTRRNLDQSLDLGRICHEAERLYPNLFQARSIRSGTLNLVTTSHHFMAIKLIEGDLLQKINLFAQRENLPPISRIRLTEANE